MSQKSGVGEKCKILKIENVTAQRSPTEFLIRTQETNLNRKKNRISDPFFGLN